MNDIQRNINTIQKKIPKNVKLIAISKKQSIDKIKSAIEAGIHDFGENQTKEFLNKWDAIGNAAQWHFVGHLQTNKVKSIVDKVTSIQSIDSLRLFQLIDKEAEKNGKIITGLIQINIGYEKRKWGMPPPFVPSFLKSLPQESSVKIVGFMCIPPFEEDLTKTQQYFKNMRGLLKEMKHLCPTLPLTELSMGMSRDYELAIQEGATQIRIGEAIFGKRGANSSYNHEDQQAFHLD